MMQGNDFIQKEVLSIMSKLLKLVGVVALSGALMMAVGCGGGGGDAAPTAELAATTDATVDIRAATVPGIEGSTFSLPSGAMLTPGLANQPITLAFTGTATPAPTATFNAPNMTGTDGKPASCSGPTQFGSCTFTITSSNIPGVTVGQQITVNPCRYNVKTQGIRANGRATTVQILLQLGLIPSAPNQAEVEIDSDTGIVTVNNCNTGVSVSLQVVTGSTGGTGGTF